MAPARPTCGSNWASPCPPSRPSNSAATPPTSRFPPRCAVFSPNDTLVLVNGHRRHYTGNLPSRRRRLRRGQFGARPFADPSGAIDHVEVLLDGAAAQYGTDAVAGVVNIILKNKSSGGNFSATVGDYFDRGGFAGGKANGDKYDLSYNMGLPLFDKGFVNFTIDKQFESFTEYGGPLALRQQFERSGSASHRDQRGGQRRRQSFEHGHRNTQQLHRRLAGLSAHQLDQWQPRISVDDGELNFSMISATISRSMPSALSPTSSASRSRMTVCPTRSSPPWAPTSPAARPIRMATTPAPAPRTA